MGVLSVDRCPTEHFGYEARFLGETPCYNSQSCFRRSLFPFVARKGNNRDENTNTKIAGTRFLSGRAGLLKWVAEKCVRMTHSLILFLVKQIRSQSDMDEFVGQRRGSLILGGH